LATEPNCKQSRGGEGRDCSHMIPCRPTDDVVCPQPSAIAAGRINGRERVVSRHVEKHCYQDCPDQIEKAADEQINCVGSLPPSQRRDCQEDAARRCSKENSEEQGIDHHDIEGLHGAGERRASAFITNAEKAKNTPPISPQPSPDENVRMEINLSIIC